MSCESLDASDVPMGGEEQLSTAVPAAPNTPAKAGNAAGDDKPTVASFLRRLAENLAPLCESPNRLSIGGLLCQSNAISVCPMKPFNPFFL